MSFINEMQVLITSDELAKDVAGAKALLERHQEHRVGHWASNHTGREGVWGRDRFLKASITERRFCGYPRVPNKLREMLRIMREWK